MVSLKKRGKKISVNKTAPQSISTPAVKHLIIHQHRRKGILSIHDCHLVWTLKKPGISDAVLSRIITGSHPKVHYGSEHSEIRRRVNHHKLRIEKGKCFAGGSLGSSGPRIGPKATERYRTEELHFVGEFYFALAANPRPKRIRIPDGSTMGWRDTWQTNPGVPSLWCAYREAHREGNEARRSRLFRELLDEFWSLCPCLPTGKGPTKRLREEFSSIMKRIRRTRGDHFSPAFKSAKTLALALAAAYLNPSDPESVQKTLCRRVSLYSPWESGYA